MKRARSLAEALTLVNPGRGAGSADAGLIADVSYRTDLTPYIHTTEEGARMLVISIIRLAIADLVVEDSAAGVKAALAAGMRVAGLTAGRHSWPGHGDQLLAAGAARIFTRTSELTEAALRAL